MIFLTLLRYLTIFSLKHPLALSTTVNKCLLTKLGLISALFSPVLSSLRREGKGDFALPPYYEKVALFTTQQYPFFYFTELLAVNEKYMLIFHTPGNHYVILEQFIRKLKDVHV